MVATTRLIRALAQLGLSTYEARAYAALVRSGPVTGYQLSRASGVPRSRIYEAIEKLIGRGMVLSRKEQPPLYRAAPCEEVLARSAADLQKAHDTIRASCCDLREDTSEEGVWNMTGRRAILARAQAMVQAAVSTLDLAVVAADIRELEPALVAAERRGARIRAVVCGAYDAAFGEVLPHRFGAFRTGDLALVADASEALAGITEPEEEASAAWSRAAGFVHITREYVLHEIFIARAFEKAGPDGAALDRVYRSVFDGA